MIIVILFESELLTIEIYLLPASINLIILEPNLGSICPIRTLSESSTFTVLWVISRLYLRPGLNLD